MTQGMTIHKRFVPYPSIRCFHFFEQPFNIQTLSEEEKNIFKYIDDYKPRTLRLSIPLKGFIPDYIPAIETIHRPIRSFVAVSSIYFYFSSLR
jgi:hypothetical protein